MDLDESAPRVGVSKRDAPAVAAAPLDKDAIVRGIALGLRYGRRLTAPFLHYIYRPFSNELYSEMLRLAPNDDAFIELMHGDALRPDGTSTRLVLPFSKAECLQKLTPEQRAFWGQLNAILCGPEVRALYFEALEPDLKARFVDELPNTPVFPRLVLMRDFAAYKINIHPDAVWKTITAQFYLPPDHEQKDIGTGIYERHADGKFSEAHRVEFTPGNAYCFAVTKNSWHGVKPLGELIRPRNSLMLTFFNKGGLDY
jgi:hypothetical protein